MTVCNLGRARAMKTHHKYMYSRHKKRFDLAQFKLDLCKVNWDDVLSDPDPISAFEKWSSKFNLVLNKHAPYLATAQG